MVNDQFKTFSINLNAQHVNGITPFDLALSTVIRYYRVGKKPDAIQLDNFASLYDLIRTCLQSSQQEFVFKKCILYSRLMKIQSE